MELKPPRTQIEANNIISDEEVDKLSLDLRCCWHIQPWRDDYMPKSIADWASRVGWLLFRYNKENGQFPSTNEAVEQAVSEVYRLKDFLTRELIVIAENLGKRYS